MFVIKKYLLSQKARMELFLVLNYGGPGPNPTRPTYKKPIDFITQRRRQKLTNGVVGGNEHCPLPLA